MKKMFFAAAMLAAVVTAKAQLKPVTFGIKGGVNLSNVNYNNVAGSVDSKSITGYHFGAYAKIKLAPNFFLQPEGLFMNGAGFKVEAAGINSTVKIDYITVPLLLKYDVASVLNNKIGIIAGPQFGLLLNAKSDVNSIVTDVKDQYNSSDFGVVVGAETTLFNTLTLGARYNLGLTDITKDAISEAKNKIVTVSLGIKLF